MQLTLLADISIFLEGRHLELDAAAFNIPQSTGGSSFAYCTRKVLLDHFRHFPIYGVVLGLESHGLANANSKLWGHFSLARSRLVCAEKGGRAAQSRACQQGFDNPVPRDSF